MVLTTFFCITYKFSLSFKMAASQSIVLFYHGPAKKALMRLWDCDTPFLSSLCIILGQLYCRDKHRGWDMVPVLSCILNSELLVKMPDWVEMERHSFHLHINKSSYNVTKNKFNYTQNSTEREITFQCQWWAGSQSKRVGWELRPW